MIYFLGPTLSKISLRGTLRKVRNHRGAVQKAEVRHPPTNFLNGIALIGVLLMLNITSKGGHRSDLPDFLACRYKFIADQKN